MLFQKPYQDRIPEYTEIGASVDPSEVPYVLVPEQAKIVTRALDVLGMEYSVTPLSGYLVLHGITPSRKAVVPIPVEKIAVSATDGVLPPQAVIDGDARTRWGSGKPQSPEMIFSLSFPQGARVSALRYDLGEWIHDYPRGLRIEADLVSGERVTILRPREFRAIRYLYEYEPVWMMYLEEQEVLALHFHQTGEDPVFDWSIAEITVFGDSFSR